MSTPLAPTAVQALAQQAAESPAHLDPVLVQQVCREWQIGQQAAALQRCIVEAAYQDKLKAERERDAALAERDALVDIEAKSAGYHLQRITALDAALTEARRVLREANVLLAVAQHYGSKEWLADVVTLRLQIAAVLAQEEK